uniref:F-box domain-containing protein n=1 Tax=Setaria viridis TaxID=4556 RepID=A0A4U6SY76_SETVI|nr:hypothetical protein SEVIR_9G213201v2 [Setaria viridis]
METTASRKRTKASALPDEIVEEILARLPAKSLRRFQCVSRPWREPIASPPPLPRPPLLQASRRRPPAFHQASWVLRALPRLPPSRRQPNDDDGRRGGAPELLAVPTRERLPRNLILPRPRPPALRLVRRPLRLEPFHQGDPDPA